MIFKKFWAKLTNNQKYAERAKYLTTQAKDDPINFWGNSGRSMSVQ